MNESIVREAFKEISFPKAKSQLDSSGVNLEAFLQLLIRSNDLFFKYPNPRKEKLRDEFFEDLKRHFSEHYKHEWIDRLAGVIAVLKRTESGYRRILSLLAESASRRMSPDAQCSAAIALVVRRFEFIHNRLSSSISRSLKRFAMPAEFEGVLDDGSRFSIDSAATGFSAGLSTTLMMYAIENKWISSDGTVLFPTLGASTEDELKWSEETELLAASWRRWERVEQRRRYWGGSFFEITEGREHADLPPGNQVFFEYIPEDEDRLDCLANERLKDSAFQAISILSFESLADKKVVGIERASRIAPDEYLSFDEIYFAAFLSAVLGVDVRDDPTRYEGLRIVEWLRGYCALTELSLLKAGPHRSTRQFLIKFAPNELVNRLARLGLSEEVAERFIRSVTFSSRNFDLFDCPLLKFRDNALALFVPAAIRSNASAVTYSNLSSFGETFEKKGKRFEQQVLRFLKEKGFKPFSINSIRDGEPYEIDVILPWENYLFVFECKNKALSDNHPIQSYYFAKQRDEFIKQVKRQIAGMRRYPDMLMTAGGVDIADKIIVPCVLYELPYAEIGEREGVYIADWYGLSRFFSDRYISFRKSYDLFKKHKLTHRTAIYSFWKGEQPAASDLLRQLTSPMQVRVVVESLVQIDSLFAIGKNAFGLTHEWYRKAQTLPELARILGFDAQEAKDDGKQMEKRIAFLNKRFERKRLLLQDRAFREKCKRDRC
jgi:Nuclease-related domain